MSDAPQPVLVVEGLGKRFGEQPAIAEVGFSVRSGEIVSLLGPSGCGKTTTLRCIAGFYQPDAGSITVSGRLIASASVFVPPEDRNLAMVFQNYVLWPHMTNFENVAYGLRLRGVKREEITRRVHEVMALLGLDGLASRYPHQLSGGQQQRLSVARSLVVEPQVLLLDEPFSNLDAKLRIEIRQEMRNLMKRFRTTAVYVTHDQEEAMALSDRIILMHGGRIVQEGRPVDLFDRPSSRFAAAFFGVKNFLAGTLVRDADGTHFVADEGAIRVPVGAAGAAREGGVLLGIRETGVDVRPAAAAGEGWFAGTIADRSYLGEEVQLSIRCGATLTLSARVPGSEALGWPEGVAVRIRPEAALLLPRGNEAP